MTPDPTSAIEQARKEIDAAREKVWNEIHYFADYRERSTNKQYAELKADIDAALDSLLAAAAHGRGQGEKRIEYRAVYEDASGEQWPDVSCETREDAVEMARDPFRLQHHKRTWVEQREVIEVPWTPLSEDTT